MAGGTTALWDYLQQHPQMRPAIAFPDEAPHYTKELHYFSNARKEYTKVGRILVRFCTSLLQGIARYESRLALANTTDLHVRYMHLVLRSTRAGD